MFLVVQLGKAQTLHVTAAYGKAILCEDNILHFEVSVDNSHTVNSSQGNFFLALNLGTSASPSAPTNYQTVTSPDSIPANAPTWVAFDLGTNSISGAAISVDVHLSIACEARLGLSTGSGNNVLSITDQVYILRGCDTTHQMADTSWDMVVQPQGPPTTNSFVSKQIALSVYYAYFAESTPDVSLNYTDIYNEEHFGRHITRSFLYTDVGPDVNDTSKRYEGVFTFSDHYGCTLDTVYIPEIRVVIGADTNLYANSNGATASNFSYNEIPYSIRHGESIRIIESLVFPNYEHTCIDAYCDNTHSTANHFSTNFNWGCTLDRCENDSSTSTLSRDTLRPALTIYRMLPAPTFPPNTFYWDTLLSNGSPTQWKFKLKNTGSDVCKNVKLDLLELSPYFSSFYYINHWDSVHITAPLQDSINYQITDTVFLKSIFPPDANQRDSMPACLAAHQGAIQQIKFLVGRATTNGDYILLPGDEVEISFPLEYCCPSADVGDTTGGQRGFSIFNQAKRLNSWQLQAIGYDECGVDIHNTTASDTANGLYSLGGVNSISINGASANHLNLLQDFSPTSNDFSVPSGGIGWSPWETFFAHNLEFNKQASVYLTNSANLFSTTSSNNPAALQMHGSIRFEIYSDIGLEADSITLRNQAGTIWPNTQFTLNIYHCYQPNTYSVEFDFAQCPTGTDLQSICDFLSNSDFNFKLRGRCSTASCQTSPLNSNPTYHLRTYVSGLDGCWVPMTDEDGIAMIHCPGCNLPGMSVDPSSQILHRTTFGFPDANNNGLADSSVPIDSAYLALHPLNSYQAVAVNRSMVGDSLILIADSHIENTSVINLDSLRGPTYNINLNHMFCELVIPYSDSTKFDVRLVSLDVTMTDTANTYSVSNLTPTSSVWGSLVYDQRNDIVSGSRLGIVFFDLSETVLRSLFTSLPSSYQYSGREHFTIRARFYTCKNYYTGIESLIASDNRFQSNVHLNMYLSGTDFPHLSTPVFDAYEHHLRPTSQEVLAANDTITGDMLYFCESFSEMHYFFSVRPKIHREVNNAFGGDKCEKRLSIEQTITIGGELTNVFPYEFRPVPPINHLYMNWPGGAANYSIGNLDTINSYSLVRTYFGTNCQITSNHSSGFSLVYGFPTNGDIQLPRAVAGEATTALFDTVCNSPFFSKQPYFYSSDEFMSQMIFFPFNFSRCDTLLRTSLNSTSVITDIQMGGCNGTFMDSSALTTQDTITSQLFSNLSTAVTNTVNASSHTIHWTVTFNDNVTEDLLKNGFLYFNDPNHYFSNVKVDGHPATDSLGIWFYAIGDIDLSHPFNHPFNFDVDLMQCDTSGHSVSVYFGWRCGAAPTHVVDVIFGDYCYLRTCGTVTINYTGGLPAYNALNSSIYYTICSQVVDSTRLSNSQSELDSLTFTVTLVDTTLQLDSVRFIYKESSGTQNPTTLAPVTPTISNWVYTYHIPSLPQSNFPGHLGSGDAMTMNVYFTPLLPANASGTSIITNYSGVTYCGDHLPIGSGLQPATFQDTASACAQPHVFVQPATTVCAGTSVQVNAVPSLGQPPYHYAWFSIPAGFTSTLQNPSISVQPNTTYYVIVFDSLGGSDTAAASIICNASAQCCYPSGFTNGVDYDFSNITARSLPFTTIQTTNENIVINGTFTVDTNFTFNHCTKIIMGPGAVINVLTGKTLTLNDSHIYSCDQMSQGIVAQTGSYVNLIVSTIEDAQYGVLMREDATLVSDHTNFVNDYIGIKMKKTPGATSFSLINVNTTFRNTSFDCTRNLVGPYSGQLPIPKDHPYAGIDADSVLFLNVVSVSGDLHFRNLNYGVHAVRTNLSVTKAKFENIQGYDTYPAPKSERGVAVYCNGYGSSMALTQEGKDNPVTPDFVNCNIAVLGKGVDMTSFNNNIVNCDQGIVSLFGTGKAIKIDSNKIDCNKVGIYLVLNDGSSQMEILQNDISIGVRALDLKGKPSNGFGILSHEMNGYNSDVKITDNDITLHQFAKAGIRLNGVEIYHVLGNQINILNNVNTSMNGIELWRSNESELSCNNVFGTRISLDSSQADIGISVQDSKSNIIGCNKLTHTAKGMQFKGSCGDPNYQTNIRVNEFGHHAIGLFYTASADVDGQYNKGNLWYDSLYQIGAYNLNTLGANNMQYFYDQSGDPKNHPTVIIPTGWFQFNGGPDDECLPQECATYQNRETYSIANFERLIRIAKDSMLTSEFDERARWEAKLALYEYLLNYPVNLDTSSVLAEFYQAMAGSAIQQLANLHLEEDSMLVNISYLTSTVQSNAMDIYVKTMQVKALDEKLADSTWKQEEIDSLKDMKQSLVSIIQSMISFNQIAVQAVKDAKNSQVDLLSNINNSVNAQEVYEVNETQVNDIYYASAAPGDGDSILNYEASLLSIAQLCPLSDGPAVYHARALYSFIDPDQDYDADITCIQNGYYFRLQHSINGKSSVYPNPTTGEVTLVCYVPSDSRIEVSDMCGKIIYSEMLNFNTDSHALKLSGFENGIYTYRIINQNLLFDAGKIIINK